MKCRICVVITARSSYARIKTVLQAIRDHPDLELQLVVGASALLDRYGSVIDVIRADAFEQDAQVYMMVEGESLVTEPGRFRRRLQAIGGNLLMLTEFGGDEFNTRLILLSHCVVQKQSGVGYIAMMLQVPIISYNLVETDYQDDMYKIIGGSFHAETVGELEAALDRLETPEAREDLARKQEEACRRYCAVVESPCSEISRVIQRHFVEHAARECPDLVNEEHANRVRP